MFSSIMSKNNRNPSIYETMQQQDNAEYLSDNEDPAALMIDEENLEERFQDQDVDQLLAEAAESQITAGSGVMPQRKNVRDKSKDRRGRGILGRSPKWMGKARQAITRSDEDDDVPESLLMEGGRPDSRDQSAPGQKRGGTDGDFLPAPVPGPSTRNARAQWSATRIQQRLHAEVPRAVSGRSRQAQATPGIIRVDPREEAMWRWTNVVNLDRFTQEVYDYFVDHGIWSILLMRALNLLTLAFVVGFSIFLTRCIDYSKIPQSSKMPQILAPKCMQKMPFSMSLGLWLFTLFWILRAITFIRDVPRLWNMHNFYLYCLEIPDTDIQTVSWQHVVERIMALRDSNPNTIHTMPSHVRKYIDTQNKQRLDAHDIANRVMRKENYLIALFNKEVFDLTLPLPYLNSRQLYTRTMEWSIELLIIDFIFDQHGQVRKIFLDSKRRHELIAALRRRFVLGGFLTLFFGPAIVAYSVALYFFNYFTEYQKNPGQLGTRSFTPLAEWKFREFNELPHLFHRRKTMAEPFAARYLDQFPKNKTTQAARFFAFVSGAFAAVLGVASLVDPELFLGFEVTQDRTVLFYLTIFTTIYLAARNAVSEDELVHDPVLALNEVTEFTHYFPAHWKDRRYSDEVRKEFSSLYQLRVVIFLEELLSMLSAPLVLWFSLPKSSEKIIDFFREFTVHVDGVGHVCSFAVFDFKKGGENAAHLADPTGLRQDYYSTKDGKLIASYYGFVNDYAYNPKTKTPYGRHARRHFQSPPAFPGLMSPTFNAETGNLNKRTTGIRQSMHQTPRIGPVGGHISPMHSILLDPHHQPSASGLRSSPQQGPQRRHRTNRPHLADYDEAEEDQAGQAADAAPPVTSSRIIEEDSHLGDSWKTTKGLQADEDTSDDAEDKPAGILNLLNKFQQVHTGGKGTGVNI